ncbi:MAG TPA: helix-turn-helix domain-containing protein [Chitinophaga sp.]|uniref:helix-turn-helix domain-containing protein n=1 Tax=Chitinophaga sp. TaxID=1869181 RepID=UPI002BCC0128|nr:helix-turn-helix domain-containing protein [Chitinophaga sp.]HVI45830.1 helix-turn-helix domain-containing protein [Chitinophaga sp.]
MPKAISGRNEEITENYLKFLDQHLANLVEGREADMLHINEIATQLFLDPGHLSNTVKLVTGHHPCYFFDKKIIEKAKQLLKGTNLSVSEIARTLTYDPSNFSKFFRKMTGLTPGDFRKMPVEEISEKFTMTK